MRIRNICLSRTSEKKTKQFLFGDYEVLYGSSDENVAPACHQDLKAEKMITAKV